MHADWLHQVARWELALWAAGSSCDQLNGFGIYEFGACCVLSPRGESLNKASRFKKNKNKASELMITKM